MSTALHREVLFRGQYRNMTNSRLSMALTGLASGALLTAPLVVLSVLGARAGLVAVPFTVFDWLSRVLPDRLVLFGLNVTLRVLRGLGFTLAEPARTAEQAFALTLLFVAGLVVGMLFFILVNTRDRGRVRLYGLIVGAAGGVFALAITFVDGMEANAAANVLNAVWVLGLFLLWGAGLARLHRAVYPPERSAPQEVPAPVGEEGIHQLDTTRVDARERTTPTARARVLTRRRFMVEVGGLVATIVVVGAGLGEVLRSRTVPAIEAAKAPIPFPNAGSPVVPVPGTRPEYTAVADHYRVDINLEPPSVDGTTWRLQVDGEANPLTLTLDQIRSDYRSQDLFASLACISNPLGGSLIGTTLWTGVPFRDILAQVRPLPGARYARIFATDGFDEVVELAAAEADPRVMLTYAWDGEPIPVNTAILSACTSRGSMG